MVKKVLVGLGNPGLGYVSTRHNAGLMLVERLVGSRLMVHGDYGWRGFCGIDIYKTQEIVLVKTGGYFMNESGNMLRDVQKVDELRTMNYELFVAHDDLDIKLGQFKIQKGVGPKVHNGLRSVEEVLGTKEFWRIRIGIENRIMNNELRITGEKYVLERFLPREKVILEKVLDEITQTIIGG